MNKILKLIMIINLVLTISLPVVEAKPSATVNGSVIGSPIVDGNVRDDLVIEFIQEYKFHEVPKDTIKDIDKMNSGVSVSNVLSGQKINIPNNIDFSDFKLLTKIEDLDPHFIKSGERTDLENVQVTWEVPNLVSNLGNVYVLHYSTVRKVWEVLKPDEVNFSKKTITCTFPDLSPVAVIYRPITEDQNSIDQKSVKTGDNSQIVLYVCTVLAAMSVLFIVYKRKENKY